MVITRARTRVVCINVGVCVWEGSAWGGVAGSDPNSVDRSDRAGTLGYVPGGLVRGGSHNTATLHNARHPPLTKSDGVVFGNASPPHPSLPSHSLPHTWSCARLTRTAAGCPATMITHRKRYIALTKGVTIDHTQQAGHIGNETHRSANRFRVVREAHNSELGMIQ